MNELILIEAGVGLRMLYVLIMTFGICFLLIKTSKYHQSITFDTNSGLQKMHINNVPRVGGIAVYLSLCSAGIIFDNKSHFELAVRLCIAGTPAFAIGLYEDLTKGVPILVRLMLTFFSALMGVVVAGYSITHISSVLVVDLFQIKIVAVMITAISICGILNSINMVDGLNGLAGFILVTGFAVIGLISFAENDVQILLASVMAVVALISFLFWNWPRGKIFLGDGGAYFFGVYLALTCVMLVERNREISPFAALLICIYPFTDTLFSIYRRVLKRRNFGHADNLHLHTLIYRRYFSGRRKDVSNNSRAGLVVALFSLPPAVCAYVFRSKEEMAIVCCLAFGAAYVVSYKKVVNFAGSCFKFHKFNREIKNENKR